MHLPPSSPSHVASAVRLGKDCEGLHRLFGGNVGLKQLVPPYQGAVTQRAIPYQLHTNLDIDRFGRVLIVLPYRLSAEGQHHRGFSEAPLHRRQVQLATADSYRIMMYIAPRPPVASIGYAWNFGGFMELCRVQGMMIELDSLWLCIQRSGQIAGLGNPGSFKRRGASLKCRNTKYHNVSYPVFVKLLLRWPRFHFPLFLLPLPLRRKLKFFFSPHLMLMPPPSEKTILRKSLLCPLFSIPTLTLSLT